MMGERDPQAPMWSYRVNLDKRVRRDHPLRRINGALDLSFVRGQVAHSYGRRGNKSVPPEVILRMMLLLFLDDIKSERELMRIIPERLDYLWFLGYGLDDEIPDHSVLSKARKRWGREVFLSLFSRVVQQCVEAGLVAGSKIHVDASLVDAHASLRSVKPLEAEVLSAIERTAREQLQKLDESDQEDEPPSGPSGGAPGQSEVGKFYKANRHFRSTTDPEATLVRQGGLRSRPRYKNHRVVDDAHEIITALETTTGAVDEGHRLLDLIQAHEDVTQHRVETVIADARYGTTPNLIGCQKRGIRPHLAVLVDTQAEAGNRDQIYPESRFVYQTQSDTYLCPAGEVMRPRRCHPKRLTWEYVTQKGTCLLCQLRAFCTRSKTGRTIHRHREQTLLDAAKEQAGSVAGLADRKRRQHLMERSFADATNCHGFKRARWRGLWKQAIQDLLIATVQNLRKLVRHLTQTNPELAYRLWRLIQELTALLTSRARAFAPPEPIEF
jgi:transposase